MLARPSNGLWSGVLVGVAVLWACTLTGRDPGERPTPTRPAAVVVTEDDARALVDQWAAMRAGTWTVESTYLRTTDDGRRIGGTVHEAQRPPDHVRTAMGSTDAMIDGYRWACAATMDGAHATCRRGDRAGAYGDEVATELRALREQVLGDDRRYDVGRANGCFVLTARSTVAVDQWGRRTTLCFDAGTGALIRTEITKADVTDLTEATEVRGDVTDVDLRLPA